MHPISVTGKCNKIGWWEIIIAYVQQDTIACVYCNTVFFAALRLLRQLHFKSF